MKNIFKIYKRDLKNLFTNYVAIIIILGLAILPSLYAWFNIRASWDPYGSTKGIKVAVVNKDKGYKINSTQLNVGEDIIEELKNNHDIGWVFTDEKDANYGVNHGQYYASIVISESFSKDITSFLDENPKKPELIYNVNEKTNAIAPKITDKGASSIQQSVSQTFVEMVNGVIFENFNKIGVEIENQRPNLEKMIDVISNLNSSMDEVEVLINELYEGSITVQQFTNKIAENVPLMEETINSAISVADEGKDIIEKSKKDIEVISPFVREKLIFARDKAKEAEKLVSGILDLSNSIEVSDTLKRVKVLMVNMEATITNLADTIDQINKVANNSTLKEISKQLRAMSETINSQISILDKLIESADKGENVAEDTLIELKNSIVQIEKFLDDKINSFDTEIKPALDQAMIELTTIADNSLKLLNDAKSDIPTVENLLKLGKKGGDFGEENLRKIKDELPYIKESISNLNEKLSVFNDDEVIDMIIGLLKTNATSAKTFISTPVDLVQQGVYKIPNYGSAMSPFYTVLAIWVGTLILASILTVEVNEFKGEEKLKSYEKFFGKYLFFLTIALVQGVIIAIGDKYLLGCYIANTKLFMLSAILCSLVFSMIVYTLVSVLGNVGKAIGVILLVLQVAASGGTFPVEVTPPFFQAINPFLPFTYAIGVMREAVAGPIKANVIYDISMLCVYFIVAVIIGVLLKKPLDNIIEKFNKKFKESGLSE